MSKHALKICEKALSGSSALAHPSITLDASRHKAQVHVYCVMTPIILVCAYRIMLLQRRRSEWKNKKKKWNMDKVFHGAWCHCDIGPTDEWQGASFFRTVHDLAHYGLTVNYMYVCFCTLSHFTMIHRSVSFLLIRKYPLRSHLHNLSEYKTPAMELRWHNTSIFTQQCHHSIVHLINTDEHHLNHRSIIIILK